MSAHATPRLTRRCADLLVRLTTPEKLGLLTNTALGVPRLFIPPYQWRVPAAAASARDTRWRCRCVAPRARR
jgi:hypothetical protein